MHLLPLLGKALKDDVRDLLEDLEMPVVYDFDQLHEGQPEKYWAAAQQAGIQLRFDESQTLDAIFLYIVPDEGFAAYKQGDLDVPIFANTPETLSFGESHRLQINTGRADFLGVISDWIRNALCPLRFSRGQAGTSYSHARRTLSRLTWVARRLALAQ